MPLVRIRNTTVLLVPRTPESSSLSQGPSPLAREDEALGIWISPRISPTIPTAIPPGREDPTIPTAIPPGREDKALGIWISPAIRRAISPGGDDKTLGMWISLRISPAFPRAISPGGKDEAPEICRNPEGHLPGPHSLFLRQADGRTHARVRRSLLL